MKTYFILPSPLTFPLLGTKNIFKNYSFNSYLYRFICYTFYYPLIPGKVLTFFGGKISKLYLKYLETKYLSPMVGLRHANSVLYGLVIVFDIISFINTLQIFYLFFYSFFLGGGGSQKRLQSIVKLPWQTDKQIKLFSLC